MCLNYSCYSILQIQIIHRYITNIKHQTEKHVSWNRRPLIQHKGPFKRMQHVGTTSPNVFDHNMLSSFKHHVGTCWAMLDRVGRCWMKFDFWICQTFHPASANIFLRACTLVDIHWYQESITGSVYLVLWW